MSGRLRLPTPWTLQWAARRQTALGDAKDIQLVCGCSSELPNCFRCWQDARDGGREILRRGDPNEILTLQLSYFFYDRERRRGLGDPDTLGNQSNA